MALRFDDCVTRHAEEEDMFRGWLIVWWEGMEAFLPLFPYAPTHSSAMVFHLLRISFSNLIQGSPRHVSLLMDKQL